jgi:hypothetical protein
MKDFILKTLVSLFVESLKVQPLFDSIRTAGLRVTSKGAF